MTKEEIYEGNRLIALFMGWKPDEKHGIINNNEFDVWSNSKNAYKFCDLIFHKDWNLLMPVVEKIESLGYHSHIEYFGEHRVFFTHDSVGERDNNKITATYKAVVQFIKWYNNKNDEN